uniref:Trafficking protein particle complex subunit n=1 Tax=Lotharella globosa TaxID=91324 RepID=A0A7S4DX55_9EUKA
MDSKVRSVFDKPLIKRETKVSLSAFSYVFSELVQHCQSQIDRGEDLEKRLAEAGYGIGLRVLELYSYREKCKKERSVIQILNFVRTSVWKTLFGRPADDLQISNNKKNEYYIYDSEHMICKYISNPNAERCAAFTAGIINGILDGAEFTCDVKAVLSKDRMVFIVTFASKVVERET